MAAIEGNGRSETSNFRDATAQCRNWRARVPNGAGELPLLGDALRLWTVNWGGGQFARLIGADNPAVPTDHL